MSLSEEMFLKFDKKQMWKVYSDLMSEKKSMGELTKSVNVALKKILDLEARVDKLEGELAVSKNANSLLKKEVTTCERKRRQDNQYTRLENVEISGIPASVGLPDLEKTVIAVAKEIGGVLSPRDISACHRLPCDGTIVRFPSRKNADALFKNARNLKNKDLSAHLGPAHPPVYINPNFCPEFRSMRWKAKRLKEEGLVFAFGTSRRGVFVQKAGGGEKIPVELDADFEPFLDDKPLHEVLYPEGGEQS